MWSEKKGDEGQRQRLLFPPMWSAWTAWIHVAIKSLSNLRHHQSSVFFVSLSFCLRTVLIITTMKNCGTQVVALTTSICTIGRRCANHRDYKPHIHTMLCLTHHKQTHFSSHFFAWLNWNFCPFLSPHSVFFYAPSNCVCEMSDDLIKARRIVAFDPPRLDWASR